MPEVDVIFRDSRTGDEIAELPSRMNLEDIVVGKVLPVHTFEGAWTYYEVKCISNEEPYQVHIQMKFGFGAFLLNNKQSYKKSLALEISQQQDTTKG